MSVPSITVPLSPMTEIDVVPAWVALDGDSAPAASWWGVPVFVVRNWITEALRKGDYRKASAFSALIPRTGSLVKVTPLVICDRSLTLGGVAPEADDDDLIAFRMQLSGRNFWRNLCPPLLPLV